MIVRRIRRGLCHRATIPLVAAAQSLVEAYEHIGEELVQDEVRRVATILHAVLVDERAEFASEVGSIRRTMRSSEPGFALGFVGWFWLF